jgi:hypothetical protein
LLNNCFCWLSTLQPLTINGSYKNIKKNTINNIIKEVKKGHKNANIYERINKWLIQCGEITSRIHGLCKICKEGIPTRIIVNKVGSPTYELAKYVARLPKLLVEHTFLHQGLRKLC